MGIFRNRGPRELDMFGPGDALIGAAGHLYGQNFDEGTLLHWLTGPANDAEELFSSKSSTKQKISLQIATTGIIEVFNSINKQGLKPGTQFALTRLIFKFATSAMVESADYPSVETIETQMCQATASATIRMAELKRIPQAHAILGDGMLQVATLMLMKDSFDSQI